MNKTTILLLVALVVALSGLFLWNPVKSMIGGGGKLLNEKGKKKGKGKEQKSREQEVVDEKGGVTVIKKWDMPNELVEISAIAWLGENRFACVQDEDGNVFIYNANNSKIEKVVQFGGPGDYEGIAFAHDKLYVMRADGVIFEINNFNVAKPAVTQYKTHLTAENDVEAFTFDSRENRLLATFKGADPNFPSHKGIYSFDLNNKTMDKIPVLKFTSASANSSKKKNKGVQAADLAVHPVSNDIYIIDASGPSLKVISASGEIKSEYQLDKAMFSQPEGLTFSPDGSLFISNEGKRARAIF